MEIVLVDNKIDYFESHSNSCCIYNFL